MKALYDALRYLDVALFVVLAYVTYRLWRERRDEASMWAVLTFASLAIVAVVGLFLPEESDSSLVEFFETAVVGVLLLFPYFLFRLASSFSEGTTRAIDLGAAALTATVVAWAIALPRFPDPGAPRSTAFQLFIYAVLLQWVLLSTFVAVRFWRAGANQPDVARRRMMMLSIAATAMSLALVVSGTAPGERSIEVDVLVQVIALASVIAFFLAFSPPRWLRWIWKREAEEEVRKAAISLMTSTTRDEVVDGVLPHAAGVVGGRGIAMFDEAGTLLGSYGFSDEEVAALDPADENAPPDQVRLEYPFGNLIVRTSRHTPFFGQDDISLLGALGALANLALQRLEAVETERQLAEARLRRRQALEINDNVVQRLAVAHYSFELGQVEQGMKAMEAALRAARRTISDLLGEISPDEIDPATLRRKLPASE